MRQQYVGYIRAVRGKRLTGNRPFIESDPSTRTEAERWLNSMLESCVEECVEVGEAGTRKYDAKSKARGSRQTGKKSKETGRSAENETENETQNEAQNNTPKKPGGRARSRPAHGQAHHAPAARTDAK